MLKIVKLCEDNIGLLNKFYNKFWDNDSYDYAFEKDEICNVLNGKRDYSPYYLVIANGKCLGYFYYMEYLNYDIFTFGEFFKGVVVDATKQLVKMFPKMLLWPRTYFSDEESEAVKTCNFQYINNKSFFHDKDDEIIYDALVGVMSVNGESDIVKDIEHQLYPKLNDDLSNLQFTLLTDRQMYHHLYHKAHRICIDMSTTNDGHFPGFHYLHCCDLSEGVGVKYLVAKVGDTFVGCICFGVWYYDKQSVSFIDVAAPYRNKGIAKQMIRELNKYLDSSKPLELTKESEMGSTCKMVKHFQEMIYTTSVVEEKW